jgi:hypothetical protein
MALVGVAACAAGPDPASTGKTVVGVQVASVGPFVGSAVVDAQGQLYVTADAAVDQVTFEPGTLLPSTWNGVAPNSPNIELALDGETLWWAAASASGSSIWSAPPGSFLQNAAATASFPGAGGDVVGLVADATAVFAAISIPTPQSVGATFSSPDSWQWPGSSDVSAPFAGDLYRIGTKPAAAPRRLGGTAGATTFLPGFMLHVVAQGAGLVYWADSTPGATELGRVMGAAKLTWGIDAGHRVGGIQAIGNQNTGFVGLAATDTTVAWAAAPEPTPGATGCRVWAAQGVAAPKVIFDGDPALTSYLCSGLALDQDYAYFAMIQVYVPPAGPGASVVLGKGIARVPLAGGDVQTAALSTDRWYGARRVVVDDTFVYAVDPQYVLRFPKTAFGP